MKTRFSARPLKAVLGLALVGAFSLGAAGDRPCLPGSYQGWFLEMPLSGPGYYFYLSDGRSGVAGLVYGLMDATSEWQRVARSQGGYPRIGIGHLSKPEGGSFPPHSSHRCGVDADIRPIANSTYEGSLNIYSGAYSRDRTYGFMVFYLAPYMPLDVIFFNDPALVGLGVIQSWPGHDDHFHVRIKRPAGFTSAICS